MTFIDDIFGKLFSKDKPDFNYKENFTQSSEEELGIRNWLGSEDGKAVISQVYQLYHLKKAGVSEKPNIHLMTSPYANGFALTFEKPLTEEIFSSLFFGFGLRMLDLGYYRVSLDRSFNESAGEIKITEKQYFKPINRKASSQKMDQIFGNVSIEKVLVNQKPSILKVLATVYSDQLYLEARPFDQFIEELLKQ